VDCYTPVAYNSTHRHPLGLALTRLRFKRGESCKLSAAFATLGVFPADINTEVVDGYPIGLSIGPYLGLWITCGCSIPRSLRESGLTAKSLKNNETRCIFELISARYRRETEKARVHTETRASS
jgi:hypothetical protein